MPNYMNKEKNASQKKYVESFKNDNLNTDRFMGNNQMPVQEKKRGFFSRLFGKKSKAENIAKELKRSAKKELKAEKERKKAMSKAAQKALSKALEKEKRLDKLRRQSAEITAKMNKTRDENKKKKYERQLLDIEKNINMYLGEAKEAKEAYNEKIKEIKKIEGYRQALEDAKIQKDIDEFEIVKKPEEPDDLDEETVHVIKGDLVDSDILEGDNGEDLDVETETIHVIEEDIVDPELQA